MPSTRRKLDNDQVQNIVVRLTNLAAFPATGESNKLYIAGDTNISYSWTGSTYIAVGDADTIQTLVDGTAIVWNGSLGASAKVTLAGVGRVLGAISNPIIGKIYSITVYQDAVGGRTLGFNTLYKFPGSTAPELNSGATRFTQFQFQYDGVNFNCLSKTESLPKTLNVNTTLGLNSKVFTISGGTTSLSLDSGTTTIQALQLNLATDINQNAAINIGAFDGFGLVNGTVSVGGNSIQIGAGGNVQFTLNEAAGTVEIGGKIKIAGASSGNYASDAAAATAGIPLGGVYHNAGVLRIRLV